MINTVNTKAEHYTDGCWRTGSGNDVVILLGSCRIMPFANYFSRLNRDNRFTICVIYVVNFSEDVSGKPTNVEEVTGRLKDNPVFTDMIKRCRWFIHEHVRNYGFLNTTGDADKNIFQLGLQPELDISVPNFNDHLILANDWIAYGSTTPDDYVQRGNREIERFCRLCELSSFPEMADHFRDNWKTTRFFWRPNHTASAFTLYLMRLMNDKFLHLDLDESFWAAAGQEDLFREPHTHVTDRDRTEYGIKW